MWCMTVRTGAFVARRNGRVFVTGNTGFPKSMDVGKAIDKARPPDPRVRMICRWLRAKLKAHPVHNMKSVAAAFGIGRSMVGHWVATDNDSQPLTPTWDQWQELCALLDLRNPDADAVVWALNGLKGVPHEDYKRRSVVGKARGPAKNPYFTGPTYGGDSASHEYDVTAGATSESRLWEGWGTALKPGYEPIVMARKPLDGTVARNVLRHGVGGLNVDGCRVGDGADKGVWPVTDRANSRHTLNAGVDGSLGRAVETDRAKGRWPPNILLTHGVACRVAAGAKGVPTWECAPGCPVAELGDKAKFFPSLGWTSEDLLVFRYYAKANRKERDAGCDGLHGRTGAEAVRRQEGSAGTRSPRAGAGRSASKVLNFHPTVKPIAVMRWLVRLVTPPGGLVVDPFGGSGTTACAALYEGARCVLIEREAEYVPIIRARVAHHERRTL
jgi:hypothetical protein